MTEKAVKPANKRGMARFAAVQALYQMDVGETTLLETLSQFETLDDSELEAASYRDKDNAYFDLLVKGVVKSQTELDPAIHAILRDDWPLARIDSLLRAILRCGAFELLKRKDVPHAVAINEYLDIAKAYFDKAEIALANGVLNRLAKQSGEKPVAQG